MTNYIYKELTHNDWNLLWDDIDSAGEDGWWFVEIKTEQYGPNYTAILRKPAKPLPVVTDHLTNGLLLQIMRIESECTEQELKQLANLREECRSSAESFNQKPTDNQLGFAVMRLNTESYFEALKELPNRQT